MSAGPVPPRTRVKICGITTQVDAVEAIRLGADALGFNGWPGSKRFLDLASASQWIATLPPFVVRTAVLVDASREEATRIAALPGIDLLQFHGAESPEFCAHFLDAGVRCIKVFRLPHLPSGPQPEDFPDMPFLIDASVPGEFGGTGQLIDVRQARDFVQSHAEHHVTLSGGLNPANIASLIAEVRPYAVDLASGVESSPGHKDHGKMKALFQAVNAVRIVSDSRDL